jgi:hypothetical protein
MGLPSPLGSALAGILPIVGARARKRAHVTDAIEKRRDE